MPKIVGKKTTVVEFEGLRIDELAGNVATTDDTLSVAHVHVSTPTAEPWLTIQYDEWLCCLKGTLQVHSVDPSTGDSVVLNVAPGDTCFIACGERFRPVFPGPTEYIAICTPAFKPERCHREEEGVSSVADKLHQLHTNDTPHVASNDDVGDTLYHMCQKTLWDEAVASGHAYFPPTFEQDGGFTHATAVPARLLATANHFYTASTGEWICLELSRTALLYKCGIVTRFEEPKAVGAMETAQQWNEWKCPHIFGGISHGSGVVTAIRPMKRGDKGEFLFIEGLTMTIE